MNTMEILTQLRASGLTLRPSGNRLIVDSDKPLTDQQWQFIRQHKAAILRALEPLPTVVPYCHHQQRACSARYDRHRASHR